MIYAAMYLCMFNHVNSSVFISWHPACMEKALKHNCDLWSAYNYVCRVPVTAEGCGTSQHFDDVAFKLDMSLTEELPITARHMPYITYNVGGWDELYTLIIFAGGFGYNHGVIVNIPGNNVTQGQVRQCRMPF